MTHDIGEIIFRFEVLWWKIFIDKHWPKVNMPLLSKWNRFRRRIAIRGSLLLSNSQVVSAACYTLEFPPSYCHCVPALEIYFRSFYI
jgi:hypothetical protein